jgi:hypothetical protein
MSMSLSCGAVGTFRYETLHGLRVHAESRSVSRSDVENWTQEAYAIWLTLRPEWGQCIAQMMRHGIRAKLTFVDESKINCDCGSDGERIGVIGFTEPWLDIVIADSGRDMEVLAHELGHVLAYVCDGVWGEESHKLFRKLGFPWM